MSSATLFQALQNGIDPKEEHKLMNTKKDSAGVAKLILVLNNNKTIHIRNKGCVISCSDFKKMPYSNIRA